MNVEFATMMSAHTTATAGSGTYPKGNGGVIMNSAYYNDVQVNYNNIYNIVKGIGYIADAPTVSPAFLYGQVTINGNNISANSTGTMPTLNEYVTQAIEADNLSGPYALTIVPGTQVNMDNNVIKYVFNGIKSTGFDDQLQPITARSNTIHVNQDVYTGLAASYPQAGICFQDINPGYIQSNIVSGPGYLNPMPPSHMSLPYGLPIVEGISVENMNGSYYGSGSTVCSNTVGFINTGFIFRGTNSLTWINNTMMNNAYGYVLDGFIGDQVSNTTYCNDLWQTYGGFTWTGLNYQTYTMGTADPMLNRLFIGGTTSVYYPYDDGTEISNPYSGSTGPSLLAFNAGSIMSCTTLPPSTIAFKTGQDESAGTQVAPPSISRTLNDQSYTLYPNPSDGNVNLQQAVTDNDPVAAEIWNATGQKVFDGSLHFDGGKTEFSMMNKVPGMYLLNLTDSKGEKFTIKFTIR